MYMQKNEPQQAFVDLEKGDFAIARQHANDMAKIWSDIFQQLGSSDSPYAEEFTELNTIFVNALDQLHQDLASPTLTLATTGTTSSGKSTLVNLLCGADIMPRMAGEMSAGIVTIQHAPDGFRCLTIEETPDAAWECGIWKNLNDQEIRERLTNTMDAFNKAKVQKELLSPVIELNYPITCFLPDSGMVNLMGLPLQTRFQIMDLPGKRNQDDQINSSVIQNCREALSIVTYNMEETDEKLRKKLVEEVLEQVKIMGGSPRRMLFALNRIDVFRKDHDWERREQEAVETVMKEITSILTERLPEHAKDVEHLSYSKLCSLPAMLAWQMGNENIDVSSHSADQINDHFSFMIPDDIIEELPRSVKKWESHDYQQVKERLWQTSYAEYFFPILAQHINDNFAKLVIAPILTRFEDATVKVIGEAIRTCTIEIQSSEQTLQEFKEKLNQERNEIHEELELLYQDLIRFPNEILGEENIDTSTLNKKISELDGVFYGKVPKEYFQPLYLAPLEISKWLSGTVEGAMQSCEQGKVNFTGTKADFLSVEHEEKLNIACSNLISKGYKEELAKKAKLLKATSTEEREQQYIIVEALKEFHDKLSKLLPEIYQQRFDRENLRIHESLEKVMECLIESINRVMHDRKYDFGITMPRSMINIIPKKEQCCFNANANIQTFKITERNPWKLFLSQREVQYAVIPSSSDYLLMWAKEIEYNENEIIKPILKIALEYFEEIIEKTQSHIDAIFLSMEMKISRTYEEQENRHINKWLYWDEIQEKTLKLDGLQKSLFLLRKS